MMHQAEIAQYGEGYQYGFAAGQSSASPVWISVKDELPSREGYYFTITEAQKDVPVCPKGTIFIEVADFWNNNAWEDENETWKVLYWAKPKCMNVPAELAGRPRLSKI